MSATEWTVVVPRQSGSPVLPVHGRRSILAPWPERGRCADCGAEDRSGYVGPVAGDRAIFPDPRLILVCRPCALAALGLDEPGFDTHRCCAGCTDRLHVEVVVADEALSGSLHAPERAIAAGWRTRGTPWRVVDVSPVPDSLAVTLDQPLATVDPSSLVALWIELPCPLDWDDAGRG